MRSLESDIASFNLTGFYKDPLYTGSERACKNALPVNFAWAPKTKRFNVKLVRQTEKAYKFKTKKAYFWVAKAMVESYDRMRGTVKIYVGAEIKWLRK